MTKFYGPVLLSFVLVLFTLSLTAAGDAPPGKVKKAAMEGLNLFVKGRKFDEGLRLLGFESQADIDNAELGGGFQIFIINPKKFLDASGPQDLNSLIFPSEWNFLVIAEGKAKSILNIGFSAGEWIPVGIGSSGMAREMAGFLAAWPASSGYHFRYIRLLQASSSFIELSREHRVLGLFDLGSLTRKPGRIAGTFPASNLHDSEEVLAKYRPSVRRNIETYKKMEISK